jgi:hypothetical protein
VTREQRQCLAALTEDLTILLRTVEYPAIPDAGEAGRTTVKVVYTVDINGVNRTFVDWYAEDGSIASTRELVRYYDERNVSYIGTPPKEEVRPSGPETAYGGLIGQMPY